VTAVQVPAELVEFWATTATVQAEAPQPDRATLRQLAASIRALLPQPEPTCPNCGHRDGLHHSDREHDGYGIQGCDEDGCDCALTPAALPQVRALRAAERDAKPAESKPCTRYQVVVHDEVPGAVSRARGIFDSRDAAERQVNYFRQVFAARSTYRRTAEIVEVLPGGDR
jgi:hypothetical protein